MSKQTSLQWLKDVLYPYLNKEDKEYTDVLFNKAKQMEREQIIDAYYEGKEYGFKEQGEQYYNETYGGQDE